MATTANTEDLLKWLADPINKCYFNFNVAAVRPAVNGTGVGVFAKKNLDPTRPNVSDLEPNLLLRVHKSMTLNSKNCTISNLLYDEGLDGIDGLLLAVLYELGLQERSPWYGYLKSINHTIDSNANITILNGPDHNSTTKNTKKFIERYILPVSFWNDSEKEQLNGTEVEMLEGLDDAQLRYHYAVAITFAERMKDAMGLQIPYLLQNVCPPGNEGDAAKESNEGDDEAKFDETRFKQYAALFLAVTSRAFSVDNYRDLALVPGADLFNHDSYNEEGAHFVTVGEVCIYCGKDACGHFEHGPPDSEIESESDASEAEDEEESDNVVLEDLKELTMEFVEEIEQELEQEESDDEDESDDDLDTDPIVYESYLDAEECCDIVLERKVKKGDEIFNTYGDLSNAELLIKYGFCVDSNPNDTLSFGPEISQYIASLVESIEGQENEDAKEKMARLHWWVNSGYKELQRYIDIQSKEEEGCCSDDDCQDESCENKPNVDTEEHLRDHDHSHDDDEDENDEEDEYEWMEQCKLGYPGHFNGYAIAVATLLTTSAEVMEELQQAFNDEELMSAPGYAGAFVEKKLIMEANKETNKLLKEFVQAKIATIGDAKLKSTDYKRMLKKASGRKCLIYTILMNEKKMLEFALKKLK